MDHSTTRPNGPQAPTAAGIAADAKLDKYRTLGARLVSIFDQINEVMPATVDLDDEIFGPLNELVGSMIEVLKFHHNGATGISTLDLVILRGEVRNVAIPASIVDEVRCRRLVVVDDQDREVIVADCAPNDGPTLNVTSTGMDGQPVTASIYAGDFGNDKGDLRGAGFYVYAEDREQGSLSVEQVIGERVTSVLTVKEQR